MPSKVAVNDKKWREVMQNIRALGTGPHVRVGVLAERGGNVQHGDAGLTLIELAAIHEFGSPVANIPERSFLRSTFTAKAGELKTVQGKIAQAIVERGMPVAQALNLLGAWAVSAVKSTITGTHIPPPLQPETVARKGSDRPLLDTGQLLGSISYVVVEGGSE